MPGAVPDPAGFSQRRSVALRALNILDTPREAAFDRLVFVAAQAFRVPMAAVSLIDGERQWFKAYVGMNPTASARIAPFCNFVVQGAKLVAIEDLTADERFSNSTEVSGGLRFYAGAPLFGPEAVCVGALCVLDRQPRTATAAQLALLSLLAEEATSLLLARVLDHGMTPSWLGYSALR